MSGWTTSATATAIYERSFAIIRAEADLARFSAEEAEVAVRMIHACGLVEAARRSASRRVSSLRRAAALAAGAPILCDAEMVAHGVTRARLPAGNEVICTLRDPRTPELAARARHHALGGGAGALARAAGRRGGGDRQRADGAVPSAGDAGGGAPRPAAIIGMPVGFVGAAESKEALAERSGGCPRRSCAGGMGGSAMTAAAVNALARPGM